MRPPQPSGPIVSVIMANYNGARHLAEAIESVRRQTLRDLEIIISDDASTDGSIDIVARIMALDPRIRLLRSAQNSGPGPARNRALDHATGGWIAIMDSDDLMDPGRLETLVEAAVRDGADMVADDLLEFVADPSRSTRALLTGRWARAPFWVDILDYVRLNHLYGAGPQLGYLKPLFRASLFAETSTRYDETLRIAEDYDLVLRLLHSGMKFRVYPLRLYFYRRHSASVSHRLSENVLQAIMTADLRFHQQACATDRRLAAAVEARTHSVKTAMAYEKLLNALKAGDWPGAFSALRSRPQAAALLRLPLAIRLRRLVPSRLSRKQIRLSDEDQSERASSRHIS
jgi:glycosyltransferase involved in cell wall biosynthesis